LAPNFSATLKKSTNSSANENLTASEAFANIAKNISSANSFLSYQNSR